MYILSVYPGTFSFEEYSSCAVQDPFDKFRAKTLNMYVVCVSRQYFKMIGIKMSE